MKKYNLIAFVLTILFLVGCSETDPWSEKNDQPFPCYPEVPTKVQNSSYIYVTHTVPLNSKQVRNYTMCFDKTKYAACWVAYPMHNCYIGAYTGRTYGSGSWPTDPDISSSYQAKGYYPSPYNRGHQIPSADRQTTEEMNTQTYYMSNMTPQLSTFNSGIWSSLENRVRSYVCNDTLYVVTGAYWANTDTYAGKYPVPTHYFKVLLRTKSGSSRKSVFTASKDELKCIGFWLEHTENNGTISADDCRSVSEIEQLTGFTFFPEVNVDKTTCIPSDWGLK